MYADKSVGEKMKTKIIYSITFLLLSYFHYCYSSTYCEQQSNAINFQQFESDFQHYQINCFAIGDSHTKCCYNNIPYCNSYIYGAFTMHRAGRDQLKFLNLKKFLINKKRTKSNDIIILSLGEIDIRNHIVYQSNKQKRHIDELLEELVSNYEKTILLNKALYKKLYIIISLIIPPANINYKVTRLPYVGSIEERIYATQKINKKLIDMCKRNNFYYIDTYQDYANNLGYLPYELSDGGVHLNNDVNCFIKLQLQEIYKDIFNNLKFKNN